MNVMKHLLLYDGYSSTERTDDILDKISKYGVSSLTILEKEFLDSYKEGKQDEIHNKIKFKENEAIFEDDAGYFKFEYKDTEDYGPEVHYTGILYVPDLELNNGKKIEGRLEGRIIVYENGQTVLEFEKDKYDVFEFCNGLEYELDSFIDYVIGELYEKK